MSLPKIAQTPEFFVIDKRKNDSGEFSVAVVDSLGRSFCVSHFLGGETFTTYEDGCWSGCAPVPDDTIHANELGITPARHRLEHDLWHHLVGIFVYRTLGSPIIWRDAHGTPQPKGRIEYQVEGRIINLSEKRVWGPCEEEEWLVTALSHRYHNELSRDHGASIWLANNNHDVELMMQTAKQILDQIPSD